MRSPLAPSFRRSGSIARVGGAEYLHTLIAMVPSAASAGYYARLVREQSILRKLVEAGTRIANMGYDAEGAEVDEVVDRPKPKSSRSPSAATPRTTSPSARSWSARSKRSTRRRVATAQMLGIPTGFRELDELTGGFQAGQMIVIAARPAVGKSTLGLDIARAASVGANKASVIFSLEMSREEITKRMLAAESGVKLTRLTKGPMGPNDWQRLAATAARVSKAPLFIDDSPQHVAHGDPRQVPPSQAATRPGSGRGRLPAAHEFGAQGRVTPARGQRVLASAQVARQGNLGARHRDLAVEPWRRSSAKRSGRCFRTCANPARSSKMPTS